MNHTIKLFTLLSSLLLTSCVVVPTVDAEYDNKCQIVKKKVTLDVKQMQAFNELQCANSHECKAEFLGQALGAALILPVSAIVSGSIAVTGNTFYWLKEQGECNRKTAPEKSAQTAS